MKKFFSALLRIIMLLSFVGILVFVSIAFINSQNTSFEAYNYVYNNKQVLYLDETVENINNNVKIRYGAKDDVYASFISMAVSDISKGIDYFLNYLALQDNITRGEQDRIIRSFDNMSNELSIVNNAYNEYMEAYKIAQEQSGAEYAAQNVIAREIYLIDRYIVFYNAESLLLKNIVEIIQEYSMEQVSYEGLTYLIKAGLSEGVIREVFVGESQEDRGDIANNELANTFYEFDIRSTRFSNKDVVLNEILRTFVEDLNHLNIYSWAGNYEGYIANLTGTTRARAISAKSFFDDNF